MRRTDFRLLAAGAAALSATAPLAAQAQSDPAEAIETLRNLNLDQLARTPITSVAKRPEPLADAAASVFVINREDIRRSGATTLPEALRLAPNLEVAQVNGYTWAISARGFNSTAASNKLLVLVDGRSVVEPVGSSVLWQQVDVMVDDIDHIEVVSGPGGALWGANAVNGVINIITRRAADTQGPLLDVAAGGFRRTAQLRLGLELGQDAHLRVYAQGFDQGDNRPLDPDDFDNDAWRGAQGGFRFDSLLAGGALTAQGDLYRNVIKEDAQGSLWGGDLQAHWNRAVGAGSSVEAIAYYSRDERTAPSLFEQRDTWDLQLQHDIQTGAKNAMVWGGEVRVWRETYASQDILAFQNPTTDIVLGSFFGQDEYSVTSRLKLIAGVKLEDSSYSGFEWLPTARAAWRYDDSGLVWAAVSRSVRTPDRIERELLAPGVLEPSPNFQSETLTAFEAGWRGQVRRASVSVSTYYNLYDDLRTQDLVDTAAGPIVLTANGMTGVTAGVEAWGKLEIVRNWRLSMGADALYKEFKLKPGHDDISGMEAAGQDPSYQAQVRSEANLTSWLEFDADVRAVGRSDFGGAPAYVEGDARAAIRVARGLELAVDGRNLFNPRHIEANQTFESLPSRFISRTVFAHLRWGF